METRLEFNDRLLSLGLARVSEAAAIAATKFIGAGDEKAADQAAVDAMRTQLNTLLADFTKQDIEKVAQDTDRDFWMTAQEAKDYGIVDEVLVQRELADKK